MTDNNKVLRRDRPRRRKQEPEPPIMIVADYFKARLGWKEPSQQTFHTSANRQCGGCKAVHPPGSEFDIPITPGRPDINTCRKCS